MKMKFTFEKEGHTPHQWTITTDHLMEDLKTIGRPDYVMRDEEAVEYASEALAHIETFINPRKEKMMFLMYDKPNRMPSDCRVEYVFRPTYIISSILMTLAYRHPAVWDIPDFEKTLHSLLTSCTGRDFMGSGYEEYSGMLDTMCIFAYGDTLRFMGKFPGFNQKFEDRFDCCLMFIETRICAGEVSDGFGSSQKLVDKANHVLQLFDEKPVLGSSSES